jgi:hypothetical protein
VLALHGPRHDVSPRGVGQGVEHPVVVPFPRSDLLIYNH